MLLDHLRAKSNRAGRHNRAHGVVGNARNAVVGLSKRRDDAQVHILVGRRVARNALEQNDVLVALRLAGVERERNVLGVGDSGRENHGLVKGRNLSNHRNVIDFVGRNLVGGNVKFTKEVDAR